MIGGSVERIDLADCKRPCRTVRTLGENRRAGDFLEPGRERRMVDMRMGHKDVRDVASAYRVEQRLEMRFVRRARVDDDNAAAARNVGIRAVKSERAGIVGGHAQHVRGRFHGLAMGRFESGLEFRRFHDFHALLRADLPASRLAGCDRRQYTECRTKTLRRRHEPLDERQCACHYAGAAEHRHAFCVACFPGAGRNGNHYPFGQGSGAVLAGSRYTANAGDFHSRGCLWPQSCSGHHGALPDAGRSRPAGLRRNARKRHRPCLHGWPDRRLSGGLR